MDCLVKGMAEHFGVEFEPLTLDTAAEEEVRRLQKRRYESDAWTLGRSDGPLY
jgi:lipoate-protein ligase A